MKAHGLFLFLSLLLFPGLAPAAWEPVLPSTTACDTTNRVCFDGRIDFEANRKIIEIRGRLSKTASGGKLLFEFTGETPQGEAVFHSTEVPIRGQYNESISHKFGPPYSNRTNWSLYRITFESD